MRPWLETLGSLLLAAVGVWLGRRCSRMVGRRWLVGCLLPLLLIIAYALAMRMPALTVWLSNSWCMFGVTRFALVGFMIAVLLTTLASRLSVRRARILTLLLMATAVFAFSIWPYLASCLNRSYLKALQTKVDSNGVCRQSTRYTCGPAAAVTALRRLDLPAEEGEIALECRTSMAIGTPPEVLALELQRMYAKAGITAELREFKSLDELRSAGLTLAVVELNFYLDHYVTVLEVSDHGVLVGDPLSGLEDLSHEEFLRRWRSVGVVLHRTSR